MGYSRKNPHLPNRWVSGNSLGGGSKTTKIQAEGGVEPKKIFFGDHFQLNVTTNSTALQFYGSTALQPTWIGINTLWW